MQLEKLFLRWVLLIYFYFFFKMFMFLVFSFEDLDWGASALDCVRSFWVLTDFFLDKNNPFFFGWSLILCCFLLVIIDHNAVLKLGRNC